MIGQLQIGNGPCLLKHACADPRCRGNRLEIADPEAGRINVTIEHHKTRLAGKSDKIIKFELVDPDLLIIFKDLMPAARKVLHGRAATDEGWMFLSEKEHRGFCEIDVASGAAATALRKATRDILRVDNWG